MSDRGLVIELLKQVHNACCVVLQRFVPVGRPEDFTSTPEGMEKLDAICMQLIAIGEGLKKIDQMTDGELLPRYSSIDWKKAKALRDILSHHYFDLNAEAIFDVCETKMPAVAQSVAKILEDLENEKHRF